MGASESKLVFKQGIFRLSEEKDLPAGDPYWARVCRSLLDVLLPCVIDWLTNRSSGSFPSPQRTYSACSPPLTYDEPAIMHCPTLKPYYSQ